VRSHLTRVVVPVVGLLAVTTALALVGIAPILLFPASKETSPRPIAPSASSQVATVAAPVQPDGGSEPASPAESPNGPEAKAHAVGTPPAAGPNAPEGGGTDSTPQEPGVDRPDKVARPSDEPADEDKQPGKPDEDKDHGKQKTKNGKALGHSKDKANGKAKGHGKWQGRAAVAFPPRAAKPGHVHPASAPKQSGRGHRPHARTRG
jgi:hypothetical protein